MFSSFLQKYVQSNDRQNKTVMVNFKLIKHLILASKSIDFDFKYIYIMYSKYNQHIYNILNKLL